jgi:hypothetical protein
MYLENKTVGSRLTVCPQVDPLTSRPAARGAVPPPLGVLQTPDKLKRNAQLLVPCGIHQCKDNRHTLDVDIPS